VFQELQTVPMPPHILCISGIPVLWFRAPLSACVVLCRIFRCPPHIIATAALLPKWVKENQLDLLDFHGSIGKLLSC
jgi:hypothetical protein